MLNRFSLLAFSMMFALLSSPTSASALELIMFEQEACEWCEVWDKEIGPVYPKTTEGKLAPLRRVDIFDDLPKDLKGITNPRFTPTFVLFHDGKELGRIRGYPGEDFFWGMLGQLLKKPAAKAAVASLANPS